MVATFFSFFFFFACRDYGVDLTNHSAPALFLLLLYFLTWNSASLPLFQAKSQPTVALLAKLMTVDQRSMTSGV